MILDRIIENFPSAYHFIDAKFYDCKPWLMGGCAILAIVSFIVEGKDQL